MAPQPTPRLTPEQYLEIERQAEVRSEFYNGRMYAMSGRTWPHHKIIIDLAFALQAAFGNRCSVVANGMRVRVAPDGLYTYPDVVVVCGPRKMADDRKDTLVNPAFVAEVLSPSTEAYDRGFKAAQYRKIDSLREYALVSQDEPRIETYVRGTSGDWTFREFAGMNAICRFESMDCQVPMSSIFGNVDFTEAEQPVRPAE
jgi:Uma2 family endonuclease